MKEYIYNGHQYQFAEDRVPAGAEPVDSYWSRRRKTAGPKAPEQEAAEPKEKKPASKGRQVRNK